MSSSNSNEHIGRVAVVGMAARFPGARGVAEFWGNLRAGVESVTTFSEDELAAAGVESTLLHNPKYVRAAAVLDGIEMFDASFFGINPKEAQLMNPQHRFFLECAWETLESGGYDPGQYAGRIGVYASESLNTYYLLNLQSNRGLIEAMGSIRTVLSNDRDFLATRASYLLNLRGPSLVVQTACSSSLVAVHLACQSLNYGECDMALAGGVAIRLPQKTGYMYEEGSIYSRDGHCRPFDAKASGTIGGNGVGVVLLKRLDDALADGDHIHAVIRGSAVNNDGSHKVGYTAPSVEGQSQVIAEALAAAGVEPETVGYIEAHGTATPLGDPIEIEALKQAFGPQATRKSFCALGSVKSNFGHLDAAAGVAGLIKTVLALEHGEIPPSLNFEQPNPKVDFTDSPFFVNASLTKWERAGRAPRRAGVSSFGIGGTNAHVVLEEPPAAAALAPSGPHHLVVLSARSESALESITNDLAHHLRTHPEAELSNVAYTLQVGRKGFAHRRTLVCRDSAEAADALEAHTPDKVFDAVAPAARPVVFMFPGQGSQHIGMGRGLYQTERVFREEIDRCAGLLASSGLDLLGVLYPKEGEEERAAEELLQTSVTQPALFAVEYALARLWMSWGVKPEAMIGHSLGEYVAACLAGVFTLEEALALVAARGQMMQRLAPGAMLGVQMPEESLRERLGDSLSIAAANAPSLCTVAGPEEAVAALQKELETSGVVCRRLHTSHAFHSAMMDEILEPFAQLVKSFNPRPPETPYISNLTGRWITAAEATDPSYWSKHLRQTVRFADGLGMLLKKSQRVLLEVGPGRTLGTLARRHPGKSPEHELAASLPTQGEEVSDDAFLLGTLGRLWLVGVETDWGGGHAASGRPRRRVPLPAYPFERQRYWVDPGNGVAASPSASAAPAAKVNGNGHEHSRQNGHSAEKPRAHVEAAATVNATTSAVAASSTREAVLKELHALVMELTGANTPAPSPGATFFELGVDSLLLIQATQLVQRRFGVELSFRQLLEEYPTLDALAGHLEQHWTPTPAAAEPPPQPADVQAQAAPRPYSDSLATPRVEAMPSSPSAFASASMTAAGPAVAGDRLVSVSELEHVVSSIFDAVSQQLAALRQGGDATPAPAAPAANAPTPSAVFSNGGAELRREPEVKIEVKNEGETFVPFRPINVGATHELTERQREHLSRLIERYAERTNGSKRVVQETRAWHADSRLTLNYRQVWKELVYPIVGERSAGSRVWDVDGNEYLDFTMGFGVNLFGHSPSFIVEALERQLRNGMLLGPQAKLVGEAARMLCELTGMERAAFCNSGTEGVMSALRLARAATGRDRIAFFAGSYHGSFDGTLARAVASDGRTPPVPLAPGVPRKMIEDVLVLDYGTEQALGVLREQARDLAAVLVEPVQSRRPDWQPAEFLRELRRLTEESGTMLVFDEVITGFRMRQGGAQAMYGVRADLAVYGKVLGGGLPIGAVAGRASLMDAIDGGAWSYGDDSYPRAQQTYYAGTFFKNPFVMTAAHAVLTHLRERGEALQAELNERTARLAERADRLFERKGVAARVVHCGSLFRFNFPRGARFADVFFFHLIEKGVYIWEGRNCFLSTAHSEEDVDALLRAVEKSLDEMIDGGFLDVADAAVAATPAATQPTTTAAPLRFPLTEGQQHVWLASNVSPEASVAYNESVGLYLRGPLDVEAMRRAVNRLVMRQESLRTTFGPLGDYQEVAPAGSLLIPVADFSHHSAETRGAALASWLKAEVGEPFDLARGPLMRVRVVRLEADYHLLVLTIHHIVTDGWSSGVLLRELKELYAAESAGREPQLPPAPSYRDYTQRLHEAERGEQAARDEQYWLGQFADRIPALELPSDRPRRPLQTFSGDRQTILIGGGLSEEVRGLSARHACTTFNMLLAAFNATLRLVAGQDDFVVGVHSAGQLAAGDADLIGYCLNLLPFRTRMDDGLSFAEYLAALRLKLLEAYGHQNYPLGRLIKKLNPPRNTGRPPLITVTFNVERGGVKPAFHGLEVEPAAFHNGRSKFDLSVNIVEWPEQLQVECDYNTDLFDAATVRRWVAYFEAVLRAAATDPELKLSALAAVLDEAERRLRAQREQEFKESRRRKLKSLGRRPVA